MEEVFQHAESKEEKQMDTKDILLKLTDLLMKEELITPAEKLKATELINVARKL